MLQHPTPWNPGVFIDSAFRVIGSGDVTKKFAVEVDAQSTGVVFTLNTGAQTLARTLSVPVLAGNDTVAVIGQAQTFSAAQTILAAGGLTTLAAATQDAVAIIGRAGGTGSHVASITPGTLTGSFTYTLPATAANDTIATLSVANIFSANQAVTRNTNGATSVTITNSSAGISADARNVLANDGGLQTLFLLGSSGNTGTFFAGRSRANSMFVGSGSALDAMCIGFIGQNKPIVFGSNSVEVASFSSGALGTGVFSVLYTTASTSSTTGGFTCAGGVGVAGTIYVAGSIRPNAANGINSGDTASLVRISAGTADDGGVLLLGGSTHASIASLGIARIGATEAFRWSATVVTLASGINLTMSGASALTTGTGAITVNGSVTIVTGKTLTVSDTTASTSTASGAAIIAGGLGVAGQITFNGNTGVSLRVTNGTANAAVAVTFGSVGPTGSTAGNAQGWLRISVAGTDRYIPYW